MSEQSQDPVIGRLIDNRYRVLSRIARGGMATVYLASDERLERRVAIKIMHHHLTDDEAFRDRFIREARSAARLGHPNVVSVYDQGQDHDTAYLVMEYLPGITLRELLNEHERLTVEQSLDIIDAVLSGLAAAHNAGIVHRDIKPENVLLADDGRIKLSDFGLARPSSNATATGQALLGTIAYLSPELVTRGVADVRSDIYAVGIMLYEILTGQQPYQGEEPMQIAYQHANDSVPAPSKLIPTIPQELDELVLWSTARDPEDRPSNAGDLLIALREVRPMLFPDTAGMFSQTAMLEPAVEQTGYLAHTGETQVIHEISPKTQPSRTSTGVLEQRSKRRNRRGKVWFILVLLLIASAAGTGWYFGLGPGGMVKIPALAQQDPAVAEAELSQLGLKAETLREYDWSTEKGKVSRTEPSANVSVQKGSTVTIIISDGAKPIEIPDVINQPQEEVTDILQKAGFTIGSGVPDIFSSSIPKGSVLALLDEDGTELVVGEDYPEKAPISLVISAGPIPSVVDISYGVAVTDLEAAGLKVKKEKDVYHDEIREGRVVSISHNEILRVGDEVVLTVSKGPAPVKIPNVVGMTWAEAKPILQNAGFRLDYNTFGDLMADFVTVSSVDPAPGNTAPKGSTIKVNF